MADVGIHVLRIIDWFMEKGGHFFTTNYINSMRPIRTFIAVEIGAEIRRQAEALQQTLLAAGVSAKWVDPNGMHLTLAFLGDMNPNELPLVIKAVQNAGKMVPPFSVQIAGVGAFPNLRRPKIAWVGMTEGTEEFIALHDAVANSLEAANLYRREDRGYRPHLTLGRVKADEDSTTLATAFAKHADWIGGRVGVERLTIFSSEMQRNGPEYSVLGRAEIRGKPKSVTPN